MSMRGLFDAQEMADVASHPQLFIAISSQHLTEATWQALTPRAMRWTDEVWLMDLSPCYSYWESQGATQQLDLMGVVRLILEGLCPEGFTAVASAHPWCAVLLLSYMRERGLSGLVNTEGAFGQALYQKVSWTALWSSVESLSAHYAEVFPKQWRGDLFHRRCAQMRQAMRKLGVPLPHAIKDMDPYAIRRRFGAILRDVWYWTFLPGYRGDVFSAADTKVQITDFPWLGYQPSSLPSVIRHLDYPVMEWAQVEPLLSEDFAQLCAQSSWSSSEKVTSLEWRLTLDDMSTMLVPIHFRHPHSLHLESPRFSTARLQASYSFFQYAKGDLNLVGGENFFPPPIVSWTLVVAARLLLPPQVSDIFGSADDSESRLLDLENRLPITLRRYALQSDWLPEDSFSQEQRGPAEMQSGGQAPDQVLLAAASKRPPLIQRQPQPFERPPASVAWKFLERSMCKWWQPKHRRNLQRDYYRMIDQQKQAHWVYKDSSGRWYKHGIFA